MINADRPRFAQMRYTDLGDSPDVGGGMGRRGNFNFPVLSRTTGGPGQMQQAPGMSTGGQAQQFNTPSGAVRGMPFGMQTGGVAQQAPWWAQTGGVMPPTQFPQQAMGGNAQQSPWAQSVGWPRGAFGNFSRFGYR